VITGHWYIKEEVKGQETEYKSGSRFEMGNGLSELPFSVHCFLDYIATFSQLKKFYRIE